MPEMIDKAAALKKLDALDELIRHRAETENKEFLKVQVGITLAICEIEDIPTIDAVQIVRCKDCAKRNTCDCPLGYAVEWGIGNDIPDNDDYCSMGARMATDHTGEAAEMVEKEGLNGKADA